MKTIILLNQELGFCQVFNVDGLTLTRIWEMLTNKHDQHPVNVPPTASKLISSAPIQQVGEQSEQPQPTPEPDKPVSRGRLITLRFKGQCKKCGNPIARGESAYHVRKGWVEHETCPPSTAPEKPKAKKTEQPQTDAETFAKDLAAMMFQK